MLASPENRTELRTTCARCGVSFACDPGGACWCMVEPVRLPMPQAGETCLCRDCLHDAVRDARAG